MKRLITSFVGYITLVSCGSIAGQDREILYETGLDEPGYLQCMKEILVLDRQCRTQREDRNFEDCMSVHHDFCIDQNQDVKKAGARL